MAVQKHIQIKLMKNSLNSHCERREEFSKFPYHPSCIPIYRQMEKKRISYCNLYTVKSPYIHKFSHTTALEKNYIIEYTLGKWEPCSSPLLVVKFVEYWTEIKPSSDATADSGEAVNPTDALLAYLIPESKVLAKSLFH